LETRTESASVPTEKTEIGENGDGGGADELSVTSSTSSGYDTDPSSDLNDESDGDADTDDNEVCLEENKFGTFTASNGLGLQRPYGAVVKAKHKHQASADSQSRKRFRLSQRTVLLPSEDDTEVVILGAKHALVDAALQRSSAAVVAEDMGISRKSARTSNSRPELYHIDVHVLSADETTRESEITESSRSPGAYCYNKHISDDEMLNFANLLECNNGRSDAEPVRDSGRTDEMLTRTGHRFDIDPQPPEFMYDVDISTEYREDGRHEVVKLRDPTCPSPREPHDQSCGVQLLSQENKSADPLYAFRTNLNCDYSMISPPWDTLCDNYVGKLCEPVELSGYVPPSNLPCLPGWNDRLMSYANGISTLLIPDSPFSAGEDLTDDANDDVNSAMEDDDIMKTDNSQPHTAAFSYSMLVDSVDSVDSGVVTTDVCPSPLLTPFTASKLKHTPGKYLFLPILASRPTETKQNRVDTFKSQREAKLMMRKSVLENKRRRSRDPDDALGFMTPGACTIPAEPGKPVQIERKLFAETVLFNRAEAPVPPAPVPPVKDVVFEQHCRSFLQHIVHSKGISFQLNYRRLPLYNGTGHDIRAPVPDCWQPFGTQFYDVEAANEGCTQKNLLRIHEQPMVGYTASRLMCVSGIVFNFGDEAGSYYLSLPCPLPITPSLQEEPGSRQQDLSVQVQPGLDALPRNCRILICRLVGFPRVFNRISYLCARYGIYTPSAAETSDNKAANPLLRVSKKWARSARFAIQSQWVLSGSVEWTLLSEIMSNPGLTKVCTNIKVALSALRQRDVVVRGQLEDPVIAATLLANVGYASEEQAKQQQKMAKRSHDFRPARIIQDLELPPAPRAGIETYHQQQLRLLSDRAQASLRALALMGPHLRCNSLLDLFLNIEMNTTQFLGDTEYNGLPANCPLLYSYQKLILDRMHLIEHYFRMFQQRYQFDATKISATKKYLIDRRTNKLLTGHIAASTTEAPQAVDDISRHAAAQIHNRQLEILTARAQSQAEMDILQQHQQGGQHPLLALHKEHQVLSLSLHKICSGMIANLLDGRVRGISQVIGTETGRITYKSPPLQMIPKAYYWIPVTRRVSLHTEQLNDPDIYNSINTAHSAPELKCGLPSGGNRGNYRIMAMARCLPKRNPILQRESQRYMKCRIVKVSSRSVFDAPDAMTTPKVQLKPAGSSAELGGGYQREGDSGENSSAHYDQAHRPLADVWTDAGIPYITSVAVLNSSSLTTSRGHGDAPVKQVIVAVESSSEVLLPNNYGLQGRQKPQSGERYYTFPADQVFRDDGGFEYDDTELCLLTRAIEVSEWGMDEPGLSAANGAISTAPTEKALKNLPSGEQVNLRAIIAARPGYILLSADYSQIELRLLAHFSNDPDLCASFKEDDDMTEPLGKQIMKPRDIFRRIACKWLHKDTTSVTEQERDLVKQICYAQIYGCGAKLVADNAGIGLTIAQRWMADFKKTYSGVNKFIQVARQRCMEDDGCVETLLGRKRYLPGILLGCNKGTNKIIQNRSNNYSSASSSTDRLDFEKALRQVPNTLCQGSAADLIKLAMVNIRHQLHQLSVQSTYSAKVNQNFKPFHYQRERSHPGGGIYSAFDDIRPILQIHDELLFEVREDIVDSVALVVQECMESAVTLRVPLCVKLKKGYSWNGLTEFTVSRESTDIASNNYDLLSVARTIFQHTGDDDDAES
jgi:DNA polymerase I-like protein with 3'-5' exonuclease and polymerase domains